MNSSHNLSSDLKPIINIRGRRRSVIEDGAGLPDMSE